MPYRRRPKELYANHADRLLDAMGRCRHVVTRVSSEVEIRSPTYDALEALRKAIDDVAKIVTGSAELYWSCGTAGQPGKPTWVDKGTV